MRVWLYRERTANVIWRMLMRIDEPIFLWNVFPLHPHEPDDPMSNRRHTAKERDACGALFHVNPGDKIPTESVG